MERLKSIVGVVAIAAILIFGIATFTAYVRSVEHRLHDMEIEIVELERRF